MNQPAPSISLQLSSTSSAKHGRSFVSHAIIFSLNYSHYPRKQCYGQFLREINAGTMILGKPRFTEWNIFQHYYNFRLCLALPRSHCRPIFRLHHRAPPPFKEAESLEDCLEFNYISRSWPINTKFNNPK